jgi:superfamily II DNA or RNA helicase
LSGNGSRVCPGKRTIAFCVDLEHAHHVAEAFRRAGIAADTAAGHTPIKQRQQLYADLRQQQLLVLTSCNVISIGFDEPSVEVGLMLRPTQSSALHLQQIRSGDAHFPHTGKQAGIILDQAGNLQRLGFPEDIQDYSLPQQQQGSGRSAAPHQALSPVWADCALLYCALSRMRPPVDQRCAPQPGGHGGDSPPTRPIKSTTCPP